MDADQQRSGTPPKMSKTNRKTDKKTVTQQDLTKDFEEKLNVSSPVRISPDQVAVVTLGEATDLKSRADNFKTSGLQFESNETYFLAAIEFLRGAFLLKDSSFESRQQREKSQIQNYDTAAKLFKSCAHVYESCEDVASAALAYKCMEVAYMRVVFCKLYSADRVLDELLLAAQMGSQGKSPSSASDVTSGGTYSNWISFIDCTQEFEFVYEACRKCQSTFAAARCVDAVAAIKSAIDFGYKDEDKDVEKFVGLVQNAMD